MEPRLIYDIIEYAMEDLKKIDPEILKEYCSIMNDKINSVKKQRFDEAVKFRDREREMDKKYPILKSYNTFICENIDWIIRDIKINNILE